MLVIQQNQEWVNFIHWIGIYPLDKVIHSLHNWTQMCVQGVCWPCVEGM